MTLDSKDRLDGWTDEDGKIDVGKGSVCLLITLDSKDWLDD